MRYIKHRIKDKQNLNSNNSECECTKYSDKKAISTKENLQKKSRHKRLFFCKEMTCNGHFSFSTKYMIMNKTKTRTKRPHHIWKFCQPDKER